MEVVDPVEDRHVDLRELEAQEPPAGLQHAMDLANRLAGVTGRVQDAVRPHGVEGAVPLQCASVSDRVAHEHFELPGAFRRAGWQVTVAGHDDVEIRAGNLTLGMTPLEEFDLIWPLGFGRQATYFDRMQMLKNLPEDRFVVRPDALVWLRSTRDVVTARGVLAVAGTTGAGGSGIESRQRMLRIGVEKGNRPASGPRPSGAPSRITK